ncbi:hypothetical protein F5146DRAFT_1014265, partial [Armillaria mellea]
MFVFVLSFPGIWITRRRMIRPPQGANMWVILLDAVLAIRHVQILYRTTRETCRLVRILALHGERSQLRSGWSTLRELC